MERVSVIGAGTMGRGIAQVSALAGYRVILYDVTGEILEGAGSQLATSIQKGVNLGQTPEEIARRALEAIHYTTQLEVAAAADLVIEAAPERFDLKREIFQSLDELAAENTILASNTSSLSINALAGATSRGDRFLGLHFFNPPHLMKLVELIRSDDTSEVTIAEAVAYVAKLDKTAIHCRDTPAFVVNRVARPFYGEALRLLGEGAASVEEIDQLIRSAGFPMGPFELIDLVGCDVNLAVTKSVFDATFQDPKYRPHPIQRRMVESGRLGRKTGRGFYRYGS